MSLATFGLSSTNLRLATAGLGLPTVVIPVPFAPDFEQFFQVNLQESSARVTIRHPLFEQRIERPAIAIWIPD